MTLPDIAPPLLRWYEQNKRTLPFRTVSTPYRVWVSEIMLQQTRVSAALPYFERFMAELPTVADLAACDPERLHKLWEGLGYYSRVRNLQKAAQIVMEQHGGALPADYDALLKLPGVGAYTAGAIASISFGLPVPAVYACLKNRQPGEGAFVAHSHQGRALGAQCDRAGGDCNGLRGRKQRPDGRENRAITTKKALGNGQSAQTFSTPAFRLDF